MNWEENKRIEYRTPANITIDNLENCRLIQKSIPATIRELSASGCRLQSALNLQLGQEFEISFDLEGAHRIDCAKVRVVRRLSQRTHKVVAVEFINLPDDAQHRIREFVVWQESRGYQA